MSSGKIKLVQEEFYSSESYKSPLLKRNQTWWDSKSVEIRKRLIVVITVFIVLVAFALTLGLGILLEFNRRQNSTDDIFQCSLNGKNYKLEGGSACECYQCYTGRYCDILLPFCNLDTTVVETCITQEFWQKYSSEAQITISSTYQMSYLQEPRLYPPYLNDSKVDQLSASLNRILRNLHNKLGNAETRNYTLVIGTGATQLISAAIYALSKNKPMQVFSLPPYYSMYKVISNLYPNYTQWNASLNLDPSSVIEIVCNPNNPDFSLRTPVYPTATHIYDLVYYWNHLVPTPTRYNETIMIFSLSKLAGLSASRFGWALVKDPNVARDMSHYIFANSIAASVEGQLRALRAIQLIYNNTDDFSSLTKNQLLSRWNQITQLFNQTLKYSLLTPRPALFLWVQCLDPVEAEDCYQTFLNSKLLTESGINLGTNSSFVRIAIGLENSSFELLVQKLTAMFNIVTTS